MLQQPPATMNPDAQPAVRWIKYEYPPEESWATESMPAKIDGTPYLPRSGDVFARASLHSAVSPPPPCSIRDDVFLHSTQNNPPATAAPLGRRALQQAYLPGISRSPPGLTELSEDIFNDGEIDASSRRRRDSGFSSASPASDAPATPDALLIPLPIKTEEAPEDDQLMAYMDNCVELNVDVRTFCGGTGVTSGVRAGWAGPAGSSGPRHPCPPGAKVVEPVVEPAAEPPATSHPRRLPQQRSSQPAPDGSSPRPRPDEPAPEACVVSRSKRGRAATAQPAEPLPIKTEAAPPPDRAGRDGPTAPALTKDEKMDVKRRKMAGNRLAAKRFRLKQKAKVGALQTKCNQLEATNAELVAELAAVRRALMAQTGGGPVSNAPICTIHGR